MSDVDARVALVTGASRGIGRAIALELARAGHDIVVNYVSRPDAAEETAERVRGAGQRALVCQADVSSSEDRERLIARTREALGRVDVLVNNAGVAPKDRRDLLETDAESYARVLGTNLEGPFFLTQAISRWMVEIRARHPDRSLHIVNISSLSEYTSSVHRGDYCLAKAALGMLTSLFADRLAEHGILVNSIRPGIIDTDMTSAARSKYDRLLATGDVVPLRRWGRPEDVARAVRALVSGDFDFCTGAVIDVDGGFRLKRL